jgi:RsiW-degrading membrane proteinase PrsW (M82 family)
VPEVQILFFALLGGILPALLWLAFWLGEDRLHPEPRRLLFLSFLLGMIGVPIALPLESFAELSLIKIIATPAIASICVIIAWAAIEELLKFVAAYFSGLHKKDCDEPLDPMIYLITAALGFSAAENTLFLLKESLVSGIITGNLRFIGASLLHVLSSGVIGYFMAVSFYKKPSRKIIFMLAGITSAIALHSLFNYFVMESKSVGTLSIFSGVWIAIIALLFGFEQVKRIRKTG